MEKIKVEAEGGELVLENGDSMAIIPKNKRQEALDYLKNGCNDCLQELINSLPKAEDYAQDGTVIKKENNPPDLESMSKVLTERNKNLNWVQRGINPENFPTIKNEDGSFSTHRLAYSTDDKGQALIYPTIIQNEEGNLIELGDDEAYEYARKTNTFMIVPNEKLAEYYSQNGLIKH